MGGFLITQADAHERSLYIMASATYIVVRRDPSQVGGVLMTNCGKEGPIEDGGFLITQADAHERSLYIMASAIFV